MNPVKFFPANCNSKSLFRDFFQLSGLTFNFRNKQILCFFGDINDFTISL